MIIASIFL